VFDGFRMGVIIIDYFNDLYRVNMVAERLRIYKLREGHTFLVNFVQFMTHIYFKDVSELRCCGTSTLQTPGRSPDINAQTAAERMRVTGIYK
jgi:hypothetical protein